MRVDDLDPMKGPRRDPVRVEFTVSGEMFVRIEAARGLVPRAAWIKAALESALAGAEFNRLADSPKREDRAQAAEMYREAAERMQSAPVEKESQSSGSESTTRPPNASGGSRGRVDASAAPSRPAKEFELPKIAPRRTRS